MNKRTLTKRLLTAVIGIALLMALLIPVYAAGGIRNITIYPAPDIYVNDVKIIPTDENGNPVEVFCYNGTTYLPIRGIAEALDIPVYYDAAENAAYVGKHEGATQYLLDVCPPYETHNYAAPEYFTMAGKKYRNGFSLSFSTWGDGYAYINTNGLYDSLSFILGHIDGEGTSPGSISIYLDGDFAYEFEVSADMYPKEIDIPLTGVLQVKIYMKDLEGSYAHNYYGFGEITVS